jgi:hypothetical protein
MKLLLIVGAPPKSKAKLNPTGINSPLAVGVIEPGCAVVPLLLELAVVD